MIGAYTKDLTKININQWTHIYQSASNHKLYFAYFKDLDNNFKYGMAQTIGEVNFSLAWPFLGHPKFILNLGYDHANQPITKRIDAKIWYDYDNDVFHTVNDGPINISKFKTILKIYGITWTLTKTTHLFSLDKDAKLLEMKKLLDLYLSMHVPQEIQEINLNTVNTLYEQLNTMATNKIKPVANKYSWILSKGVVVRPGETV